MMSSGKRKLEDLASQYHSGGHIPQQDGAGDAVSDDFQVELLLCFTCVYFSGCLVLVHPFDAWVYEYCTA